MRALPQLGLPLRSAQAVQRLAARRSSGANGRCSCSVSDDWMRAVAFRTTKRHLPIYGFSNPKQQLHTSQGVGTVVAAPSGDSGARRAVLFLDGGRLVDIRTIGRKFRSLRPAYRRRASSAAQLHGCWSKRTVKRPDRANLLPPENQRVHNAFYLKGNSRLILTSPNSFEIHAVGERTEAMRIAFGSPARRASMRALTRHAWSTDVAPGSSIGLCAIWEYARYESL